MVICNMVIGGMDEFCPSVDDLSMKKCITIRISHTSCPPVVKHAKWKSQMEVFMGKSS